MSDQTFKTEAAPGRSLLLPVLTFCAAAVPVLYLVFLVLRYAVPIPMLGDWEMVPGRHERA